MLNPSALFIALSFGLVAAHPGALECASDADTRLQVGKTIMSAKVADAPADQKDIKLEVTGHHVTVTPEAGVFFAVRAFGEKASLFGDGNKLPAGVSATANCTNQVFLAGTASQPKKSYTFQHSNPYLKIVVGYASKPGVVHLVSFPASAPSPPPSNHTPAPSHNGTEPTPAPKNASTPAPSTASPTLGPDQLTAEVDFEIKLDNGTTWNATTFVSAVAADVKQPVDRFTVKNTKTTAAKVSTSLVIMAESTPKRNFTDSADKVADDIVDADKKGEFKKLGVESASKVERTFAPTKPEGTPSPTSSAAAIAVPLTLIAGILALFA